MVNPSIQKHFRKFFSLSYSEKLLFFEALFYQYWVRFILIFYPIRKLLKSLPKTNNSISEKEMALVLKIKKATAQANLLAIWKNRCLVQSLAARRMLNRRRIQNILHFGMIAGAEKKLTAHAWLKVGTIEVVNKGAVDIAFTEL